MTEQSKTDDDLAEPTLQELLAHVPDWTGRIVKTQEEADAAAIELRNDGAPKHYLVVTPIEHIDIDFAVPINWLLLSTPPWPVIADALDVFGLIKGVPRETGGRRRVPPVSFGRSLRAECLPNGKSFSTNGLELATPSYPRPTPALMSSSASWKRPPRASCPSPRIAPSATVCHSGGELPLRRRFSGL
jgi:hypothetical protein